MLKMLCRWTGTHMAGKTDARFARGGMRARTERKSVRTRKDTGKIRCEVSDEHVCGDE